MSDQFRNSLHAELKRRMLHRSWTEKPYDECRCSEGGPCEPKDPRPSQEETE